jgi:tetratricopeptide (TPR) repeat protein
MASLRQRYEDRVARARAQEAQKYIGHGDAALAANDPVAAANAFRVALGLMPGDAELERRAQEAQTKADVILSETYIRQARYEEKNGQWSEAARSWGRVCKTRPGSALAHERAANALVQSKGDLHEAARAAERACELAPEDPGFRITLATVFEAAGLPLKARKELERAAQFAPQDVTIRTMLKRL